MARVTGLLNGPLMAPLFAHLLALLCARLRVQSYLPSVTRLLSRCRPVMAEVTGLLYGSLLARLYAQLVLLFALLLVRWYAHLLALLSVMALLRWCRSVGTACGAVGCEAGATRQGRRCAPSLGGRALKVLLSYAPLLATLS